MGFTDDVLTGLAVYLDEHDVATWKPDGAAYAPGELGIIIGRMAQAPKRVMGLFSYPLTDDPSLSNSVLGVQIRVRADNQDVARATDPLDAAFDVLQAVHGLLLSTNVYVAQALRTTGTPLGNDARGFPEYADSYQLTLNRPSQHRT